jgi:hypothetical protein
MLMFPAMDASDPIRWRSPSHGRTSSVTFSMRQCADLDAGLARDLDSDGEGPRRVVGNDPGAAAAGELDDDVGDQSAGDVDRVDELLLVGQHRGAAGRYNPRHVANNVVETLEVVVDLDPPGVGVAALGLVG